MERINWKNLEEKYNGEAVSPRSITAMKRKPGYKEAKENGSYESAAQVIDALVGDGKDYAGILENKNAVLIPIMGEDRTKSKNQLPIALALKLSELGGMQVNMGVYCEKNYKLTGARQMERTLNNLPEWHGEIQKGKEYVIVDDVLTSGVTINSLKDYIEDMGGKVTAVATIASSTYGKSLGVSQEQVEKLRRVDQSECDGKMELFYKSRYSSGMNGLSHNEANIVLGNPNIRKQIMLLVAYHNHLEKKKENRVEISAEKGIMWEDRVVIAHDIFAENEKRLESIFSQRAGKREDLSLKMEGENAQVKVPFYICKEAREVIKDYVERLNGKYESIRQQDAKGRWQTTALINFDEKSKMPPEICAMIIMGNKPEEVQERLLQRQEAARASRVSQETVNNAPQKETVEKENAVKEKQNSVKKDKPAKEKKEDTLSMMETYEKVKAGDQSVMVLFRIGDFYTTIADDAKKAVEVLGREKLQEVSLDGMKDKEGKIVKGECFHHFKLDTYLPELIRAGMRVAICDEPMKKPKKQEKKAVDKTAKKPVKKKGKGI